MKLQSANDYCNLVASLVAILDYKGAINLLEEAMKLFPKDGVFYCNRARVFIYTGRFQEALDDCSRGIELGIQIVTFISTEVGLTLI